MFGRSASMPAIGRACVTTVKLRSVGRISANRTVVVPASMMIEPPSGSWSSAALAIRSFCAALMPKRWSTASSMLEPLDRDGAAVHPAQHAAALEAGQVPADGLRGDVEDVGQRVDIDPTVGAGEAEDGLLPFRCVHVDSVVGVRRPGRLVAVLISG